MLAALATKKNSNTHQSEDDELEQQLMLLELTDVPSELFIGGAGGATTPGHLVIRQSSMRRSVRSGSSAHHKYSVTIQENSIRRKSSVAVDRRGMNLVILSTR
jgi:hypothetical protein